MAVLRFIATQLQANSDFCRKYSLKENSRLIKCLVWLNHRLITELITKLRIEHNGLRTSSITL